MLDWVLAMALMFGALALAVTVQSDGFSRALGILVLIVLVLYEPVLVSRTGGTLGHHFTNLRVVDDRGGNVSFLKACARLVVKGVLSWYSFVIMAATRRNQAVHDLLTRSTVQIRDPAKASPGQYVVERREVDEARMPSRRRRVLVTAVYLVVGIVAYLIALGVLLDLGLLSEACLDRDYCSTGDRAVRIAAGVVPLLMIALVITAGWKGRLFGARRA